MNIQTALTMLISFLQNLPFNCGPLDLPDTSITTQISRMDDPNPGHPLIAVAGPTGSGKSHLALRLAGTFSGEVINCHNLQLYRGFDIGTAKLPETERGP